MVADRRMLGARDVHVRYRWTHDVGLEEHERALAILSSEERDRAARFIFEPDRIGFASAHALLRSTLSDYADVPPGGWTFTSNQYGKPAIAGPGGHELTFSLAHARGLVACAVGRGGDVGIDVETLDRATDCLVLADRFFAPSEAAALRACRDDERQSRFIELWTLKEAYVKAIGMGLSHPLDTFAFDLTNLSRIRVDPPSGAKPACWQFALFAPTARQRIAVAVRSGADDRWRISMLPDQPHALRAASGG